MMADIYVAVLAAIVTASMLRWAINYTTMQLMMAKYRKMPPASMPPYIPPLGSALPQIAPITSTDEKCSRCDHEFWRHVGVPT